MSLDTAAEGLLREAAPRVLAVLTRRCGDFAAAEDALADALLAAVEQWPVDGVPLNASGWLFQVASRRLLDRIDSDVARRRREQQVALEREGAVADADVEREASGDEVLQLLFTCCHPALTPPSAIALTLRAVGGLTTAEIASAFLVPEATMAQRISRAKQSIQDSGVPLQRPEGKEREQRLRAVLHVLYLLFNEGYAASQGASLQRVELSTEAIRLVRALHALVPDDAETAGLLALLLLTDARKAARSGPAGELIPLDEQDRSRWDRRAIAEGIALITATFMQGAVGIYQLQAAIAALHDEAPRASDTDWPQIHALYGVLRRLGDNPMVALNHAVATAMVHGPAAGLRLVDEVAGDARLAGSHRVDAVRAHLLEFAGDRVAAVAHYLAAAGRTASLPERHYLLGKAARLGASEA